jgi:putative transcriptional regulator
MSDQRDDDIPEFARDTLPDTELKELWSALPSALPDAEPPPTLRSRLMSTVHTPHERFGPFQSKMADMIDLGVDKVRDLLALIADPKSWVPGPLPGVDLVHFDGGPRVASADVGFVRVPAGAHFPHHRHVGTERGLILLGGYTDSSGHVRRAGDMDEKQPGTEHSYVVSKDSDLVMLVVLDPGGIEVIGA